MPEDPLKFVDAAVEKEIKEAIMAVCGPLLTAQIRREDPPNEFEQRLDEIGRKHRMGVFHD